MAARDNGNGELLHVLFLPYLSAGHFIPLINAARLFASRGVKVTILTTPHNALPFQSTIDDDLKISGHPISFDILKFPSAQVGLPEGIESFTAATSPDMPGKVFYAIMLLKKSFQDKIRELRPDAIFSDAYFPWTVDLAKELNIPRIVYNLSTFMCYSIVHNLKHYRPHDQLLKFEDSASQSFLVPDLPDKIEFKLSQLADDVKKPADQEKSHFDKLLDQIEEAEEQSYGIVHDTFYELEPAYVDYYQKLKKPKCWPIGPLSISSSKIRTQENNLCNSAAVVEWLNEQKPKSVLYVSLGAATRFPDEQLSEMAKAMEASGVPFIWVLRENQETTWLPDDFEERVVKSKIGLLIKGVALQLTILEHSATGGFMTNCETNSIFEAVTAGVPLITWPVNTDQFYNEKHVEFLGLGVKVGTETWNSGGEISSPVLGSEKIKHAIEQLMSVSEESQNIRDKAMAMSNMAENAIKEGGSSWNNLTALIEDIKNFHVSSTMA